MAEVCAERPAWLTRQRLAEGVGPATGGDDQPPAAHPHAAAAEGRVPRGEGGGLPLGEADPRDPLLRGDEGVGSGP